MKSRDGPEKRTETRNGMKTQEDYPGGEKLMVKKAWKTTLLLFQKLSQTTELESSSLSLT